MAATAEYFSYFVDDEREESPLMNREHNDEEAVSEKPVAPTFLQGGRDLIKGGPLNVLLVFVPLAFLSKLFDVAEGVTFTLALLGLAPLAERLGFVTEQLTLHTNDSIGGLLNATFGNATELIVAASALFRGLNRLVQLSMLGSILSNMLLVLGSAFFLGGCRYKKQYFSTISSQTNSMLLILSCIGVLGPTILTLSTEESRVGELGFSRFTSVLLFLLYFAYIYFQLVTHKDLFETNANTPYTPYSPAVGTTLAAQTPNTTSATSTTGSTERAEDIQDAPAVVRSAASGSIDANDTSYEQLPPSALEHEDVTNIGTTGGLFKRENATPATPVKGSNYAPMQIESSEDGVAPLPKRTSGTAPSSVLRARVFQRCLCSCLATCTACCASSNTSSTSSVTTVSTSTRARSDASLSTMGTPLPSAGLEPSSGAAKGNPTAHEADVLGFRYALLWLGVLTVLISLLSDMISSSIEEAAEDVNLSGVFLAAIVLPIVGNAAEHASAISFAMRNKMDVAIGVAVGSSTQIALCVLPLLVLMGWCGNLDMDLNFGAFESTTLILCVIGVTFATKDGTSNWLLGLVLIAAYFVVAIGFYAHKNDSLK